MKIEQAIKAMRRGETVKFKPTGVRARLAGNAFEGSEDGGVTWRVTGIIMDRADGEYVIIRKRKKAERDVWKDPRVGDVVQYKDTRPDTVRYVDADMVACFGGDAYSCLRSSWANHTTHTEWKIISRA